MTANARPGGLRILVPLTDAYGGYGGIAHFNRDMLEALCADPRVEQVVAIPRSVKPPVGEMPDKLTFDQSGTSGAVAYVRAVLGRAAGGGFDLVYCGHINLSPLGWLAAKVARAPWLLQIHGIEAWVPHAKRSVRLACGRADRVCSVSRVTLDRFKSWRPYPEARCALTPLAIDTSQFGAAPRNEALAARLGVGGRRVIMTFGRLSGREGYKGFDEVLDALPRLAETHQDIVYVIAGYGEDSERLRAKAGRLGVSDRVVFTGMVDEAEKADLYRLADVYAMPSRGEGFGFVVLEAMASGVPTIASSIDGTREAVREGEIGMMVDPTDPEAIHAAIVASLARPREVPAGLAHFSVDNFRARIQDAVQRTITR